MSKTMMALSGSKSRNVFIVLREQSLRCASEPKHTAQVFFASDVSSADNGMLSHATFSVIC